MSKDYTLLKVGAEYSLFNFEKVRGTDSAMIFEALEDNNGYMVNIYMKDMTPQEVNLIGNAPIAVRVMRDSPLLFMPIIRFGSSPLMFEVIFDPTLYKDKRALQLGLNNNKVTFVAVDSRNNIIKSLRMASIPKRLRELWLTSWTQAFETENFSQKYTNYVQDITSRYSLQDLWERSVYIGKFGDK
ncbi:hypothetical protein D3C71_1247860 [compost metagenome]